MNHTRAHIMISGSVQGVGYRTFVYDLANAYGLSGFVRNHNSSVEIEVQGPPQVIETFVEDVRNKTPRSARVHNIDVEYIEIDDKPIPSFHILNTVR